MKVMLRNYGDRPIVIIDGGSTMTLDPDTSATINAAKIEVRDEPSASQQDRSNPET